MSTPPSCTDPLVGSMRRVSRRTRVDLPDPDRPITTNTSPGATSNETSFTPTTLPVFSLSSARESSASGVPMTRSERGPKIFQRLSTDRAAVMRGSSRVLDRPHDEGQRVAHVATSCPKRNWPDKRRILRGPAPVKGRHRIGAEP